MYLLLLQRSLLPGGSITPPWFYERFCVPLRLGANWGYWPSDSVFDQGGGVHHKLHVLMFLTWMGSFACHWHRHQVRGTSVLRLIRRTRAIEVKQLAQVCKQTWQWRESNPQPSDHESKTLTTPPLDICINNTYILCIQVQRGRCPFVWTALPISMILY
jgi:hypothetical protein